MQLVEMGTLALVTSSILKLENRNNPFESRSQWVHYCLNYATHFQTVNETIQERAQPLTKLNLQPMDAFHLACASRCDYFLTGDDRLVKRYKGPLQVKNPVEKNPVELIFLLLIFLLKRE